MTNSSEVSCNKSILKSIYHNQRRATINEKIVASGFYLNEKGESNGIFYFTASLCEVVTLFTIAQTQNKAENFYGPKRNLWTRNYLYVFTSLRLLVNYLDWTKICFSINCRKASDTCMISHPYTIVQSSWILKMNFEPPKTIQMCQ